MREPASLRLPVADSASAVTRAEARERATTVASLTPLFRPRGIAVVGVSRREGGIGRRIFDALVASGYSGGLYPINPAADVIAGRRALSRVADAEGPVDLAVIAVPRDGVLDVVDDCAAAGVRAVIVITAGFAETDEAGRALQQRLLDRVRGAGMRLVGPNCMGVLTTTPEARFNASFSPVMPRPGHLAFSSQSGALGILLLSLARDRGLGVSHFISVGNKADVSGNDLLQFWESDPDTSVIALYLESFGHPRRFARLARRIGRTKPIVAVKSGRTGSGARAAGGHTAALAASDTAVAALFKQTGVIRAATIDELLDVAAGLEAQPLPRGARVGIITNAGGPGILASDACESAGLRVDPFGAGTRDRLRSVLAASATVSNPVDMIASATPAQFSAAIETVMCAPDADALIVLYTSVDTTSAGDVARAIEAGVARGRARGGAAAVFVCLMTDGAPAVLHAGDERLPVYAFPENAARALGHAVRYAAWRARPDGVRRAFDDITPRSAARLVRQVITARGGGWLTPEEVGRVLDAFGLFQTPAVRVRTSAEAAAEAVAMGLPVVAKLSAEGLVHKTEVSGVMTHLSSADDVARAFDTLMARAREHGLRADGVRIQPMVSGIEAMIGATRDPVFGALIGCGLGGTNVELCGDVAFRLAPLTDRDAAELIDETRIGVLLHGYRGRPAADRAALTDLILRVSCLADTIPEIDQLDLNPVMVCAGRRGCHIVDARISVKPPVERRGRPTPAPR